MVRNLIKLVVFDLDNVIIDGEIIDEIGKLVDSKDKIAEITEQAMTGELDFETAIKERVELLKGVEVEKIDEIAENVPLMDGVEETMNSIKEYAKIAIITGSFQNIANKIKDKFSLDYAYSNVLGEKDGFLTGEVSGELITKNKAEILSEIIEKEEISLDECVAVGDGANDIPMIESAGLGIGFNPKPALKEKSDEVIESKNLKDILPIIEKYNASLEENSEEEKAETEETTKEEESKTEVPEKEELVITTDNAHQLKDEYEKLISEITVERDDLNKQARELKKTRDKLNAELKENLNQAIEYRDERNKINHEVEESKKHRDKINEEIKNLEWSSGRRDRIKIENEIKKIDKVIETRVLDIKKENQLVKNANDLRKKLVTVQEDDKVKAKSKELKKESEKYHEQVVQHSKQAQEYHEKMLEYFKKTDEIRKEADEAHKNFIKVRKAASAKHEDFKSVLSDIHKINKVLSTMKTRRHGNENKYSRKSNKKEKEKAEEMFEKFKHGKKLSTDELLLLQKHNIV